MMADDDELTVDDLDLSDPGDEYAGAGYDDTSFLASPLAGNKIQGAATASSSSRHPAHPQAKTQQPGAAAEKSSSSQPQFRAKVSATSNGPVDREASLRAELAALRSLNTQLSTVLASLSPAASSHLHAVAEGTSNAGSLLDTWTRMLATTEHNQRLLLDPRWRGASDDAARLAADRARRDAEVARKHEADERRKLERERKLEEERARREADAVVGSSTSGASRGRGRGTYGASRGAGAPPRGTVTGVRGTRGGVRGGSATASGKGIQRSGSVGASARARGSGLARGRARGA